MRITGDLTDEQAASMTGAELTAWSEAQALGPWRPNDARPAPPMVWLTTRISRDMLGELKAEAALRGQPCQRYVRDLLLLALRQVQASRRPG